MSRASLLDRLVPLALAVSPAVAAAAPVAWDASAGGNGNTYDVIVDNTLSWDAAQAAAEAAGGNLATITSSAEQSFVSGLLTSSNAPTGSYWFGLREAATEGVYENITGEALNYTNWSPGEPNNANGGESHGAVLWTSADSTDAGAVSRRGLWNDEPVTGYPAPGIISPAQPDVLRGGYLVEFANAGGGGDDGGGTPNAVPLPAAAYAFPFGAAFAGYFYRRMRRHA